MNKDESEKLYRALGDIRDVVVNETYKRLINTADRASRNTKLNEEQRSQWIRYKEELESYRVRLEGPRNNNWLDDSEEVCGDEIEADYTKSNIPNERKSESKTKSSINNAEKSQNTVYKKSGGIHNYEWYLKVLKSYFKRYEFRVCRNIDMEIWMFIREYKLDDLDITISDVKEDLKRNSVDFIFAAYGRYVEALEHYFGGEEQVIWTEENIMTFIRKRKLEVSVVDVIEDLRKYSIGRLGYIGLLKTYFNSDSNKIWTNNMISAVIYKNKLARKLGISEDEIKQDISDFSIITLNEE